MTGTVSVIIFKAGARDESAMSLVSKSHYGIGS